MHENQTSLKSVNNWPIRYKIPPVSFSLPYLSKKLLFLHHSQSAKFHHLMSYLHDILKLASKTTILSFQHNEVHKLKNARQHYYISPNNTLTIWMSLYLPVKSCSNLLCIGQSPTYYALGKVQLIMHCGRITLWTPRTGSDWILNFLILIICMNPLQQHQNRSTAWMQGNNFSLYTLLYIILIGQIGLFVPQLTTLCKSQVNKAEGKQSIITPARLERSSSSSIDNKALASYLENRNIVEEWKSWAML